MFFLTALVIKRRFDLSVENMWEMVRSSFNYRVVVFQFRFQNMVLLAVSG